MRILGKGYAFMNMEVKLF